MGTQPPQDYPSPPDKPEVPTTTGLPDGPDSASLCGFKLPELPDLTKLLSNFKLPSFGLPDLPKFVPPLGIDCNKANPLSCKAEWGGGRPSNVPDPTDTST